MEATTRGSSCRKKRLTGSTEDSHSPTSTDSKRRGTKPSVPTCETPQRMANILRPSVLETSTLISYLNQPGTHSMEDGMPCPRSASVVVYLDKNVPFRDCCGFGFKISSWGNSGLLPEIQAWLPNCHGLEAWKLASFWCLLLSRACWSWF